MRWIEVILSLSGGRIYCLFFLSVPEWWRTTVEFATVDDHGDSVSRSLDTILQSYVCYCVCCESKRGALRTYTAG